MEGWKQYLYGVLTCAFVCGIVLGFLSNTKQKALVRLVSGVILAVAVIRPLGRFSLEDCLEFPSESWVGAENYIAEGERAAFQSQADCIKASCEAYILDKAKELGANIRVDIILDGDLLPEFAYLTGTIAPQLQNQLQRILTTDLGIPKENQKWIRNQESN